MTQIQEEPISCEEMAQFKEMLECGRRAKFHLWEDEDPAQAKRSDSGVPCGAHLPPRGLTRGWEVCDRCIKRPLLKVALFFGFK